MSKDSKDDIKLEALQKQGAVAHEGQIYFDPQQAHPRERSQSLPNMKLHYSDDVGLEYHDTFSEDLSLPKTRSDSISSEGLTDNSRSSSPNPNTTELTSPSVKDLKAKYEKKSPPPEQKPANLTKATSGKYAGLGIDKIQEDIRKAVDPHTYQKSDSGEIIKGHYGHRDGGKSRF